MRLPKSLRGKLLVYGALVTVPGALFAAWLAARAAHLPVERAMLIHQALILSLIVLLLGPLWFFLERKILTPVRLVVEADRKADARDLSSRLIPEERIPDHEIGDMMRGRNAMLRQIDQMQSLFRRNLKHLAALSSAGVRLVEAGELQGFLEQVLDGVLDAVAADAAEISLSDADCKTFLTRVRRGFVEAGKNPQAGEKGSGPVPECPCRDVLERRQPVVSDDLSGDPRPTRSACRLEGFRAYAGVPLICGDRTVGVLAALRRSHPFSAQETDTLMAIGYLVALALENARLYRETLQLAITDGLTGLYTRRYFFERLEEERRRSDRTQRPFSVVIIDLDSFKACNDRFGHLVGDRVLRKVARHLARAIRQSDVIARYGGDEFVVLLPETEKADAVVAARRLSETLRVSCTSELSEPYGIGVTASFGVATYPEDADSVETLLARADAALYRAKSAGRGQVAIWLAPSDDGTSGREAPPAETASP